MDVFPVQSLDKTLVFSEKDQKIKKTKDLFRKIIKIILIIITILSIVILMGLFINQLINQKYAEKKKIADSYQQAKQNLINMGKSKIGDTIMVRFYGEVRSISSSEIILQTDKKLETIKITENTIYIENTFILDEKNTPKNLIKEKEVNSSEIKSKDLLEILGNENKNDITAIRITIYKIP